MSINQATRNELTRRAVIRSVIAALLTTLVAVTALWPDWIERTLGLELDGGTGAAEWLVTGGLGLLALASAGGAGLAWRRVALQP